MIGVPEVVYSRVRYPNPENSADPCRIGSPARDESAARG